MTIIYLIFRLFLIRTSQHGIKEQNRDITTFLYHHFTSTAINSRLLAISLFLTILRRVGVLPQVPLDIYQELWFYMTLSCRDTKWSVQLLNRRTHTYTHVVVRYLGAIKCAADNTSVVCVRSATPLTEEITMCLTQIVLKYAQSVLQKVQ